MKTFCTKSGGLYILLRDFLQVPITDSIGIEECGVKIDVCTSFGNPVLVGLELQDGVEAEEELTCIHANGFCVIKLSESEMIGNVYTCEIPNLQVYVDDENRILRISMYEVEGGSLWGAQSIGTAQRVGTAPAPTPCNY